MAERSGATMKTVDKALSLLDFFQPETPEWRLSSLARAAGMDKVTAMRLLASLAAGGLVERDPATLAWRLGTAVLRLARIREACFPVVAVLQPILEDLCAQTGETAHACLNADSRMTTVAIAEPARSTRVFVDPTQALPVHATASGLAFLAFTGADRRAAILSRLALTPHASGSPVDFDDLTARLDRTRQAGVAIAERSFEEDVTGIAAPILDWHGEVQATLAVACPASRVTAADRARLSDAVRAAAARASRAMGGVAAPA